MALGLHPFQSLEDLWLANLRPLGAQVGGWASFQWFLGMTSVVGAQFLVGFQHLSWSSTVNLVLVSRLCRVKEACRYTEVGNICFSEIVLWSAVNVAG